ncbi:hypothetical protein OS493_034944 [Desmophyllum pertusum]|uniref:K Homology domain-containing protein n=1 Tax=Desmophyllum pertusum TaxID=174260 RepID=A0A9W9YXS2_9CNID|nr:hypothetical protein OS493_034944 [Desmophyllum pertusum]
MASRDLDRRRSNGSIERSAYGRLKKQNKEAIDSEFVEVPRDLKGHVIGRDGHFVKDIMKKSGTKISSGRDEEGFTISGHVDQRACAKSLILEKVQEILSRENDAPRAPFGELVQIPAIYKGRVIGKGGDNLRNISTQTGAKVIRKDGEVHITSGTKQQRQQAKVLIGSIISGARLRGVENEFNKVCRFIDGWNLPKNCELKLEKVQVRNVVPGSNVQYRLIPAEEYELQEFFSSSHDSNYQLQITNDALEALRTIKHQRVTDEDPKADMWCHFGRGLIRGPDEDEADDGEWSIDEATQKFQYSAEGNYWKVGFKEGAILDEINLEENSCEKTPEDFIARYDLSYLTPCAHRIRCKVWVTKKDVDKRLEDIPIPFSDVKNILEEIHFEDGITRSRCRGWLVLPSRKYLQADILFPGCELDCRFTIRGRTGEVLRDYLRRIMSCDI